MTTIDSRFVPVLQPVIAAAREFLRDLEEDEVPAKLKRVAQSSGKRLPPPLAVSLLDEIDKSDWLREKSAAVLSERRIDDAASDAFLNRPEGWWVAVTSAVVDNATKVAEQRMARLEGEIQSFREKARSAKAQAKAAKARLEAVERAAKGEKAAETAPLREALEKERKHAAAVESSRDEVAQRLATAQLEVADLEASRADLYQRFRSVRSERSRLERLIEAGDDSFSREPIALARELDRLSAASAPYRAEQRSSAPPTDRAPTVELPRGVAPDAAEAVDAVIELDPQIVLIDGHNLLGTRDASRIGESQARRELVVAIGRFKRAIGNAEVSVVFDSALAGGRERYCSPDAVIVEFSPPGRTADDVIVERAYGASARRVVVVSNDRDVRERAHLTGALPIWCDALAAWLG